MELNPSALYVQPSGKQENAELVKPDLRLQQKSVDARSETATSKLDGDELCDQVGVWLWHSYCSVKLAPNMYCFSLMQVFCGVGFLPL